MADVRRILQPMSEMSEHSRVPAWTLGWRLKRALAEGGVAAGDMADYLGYSKAQVSRYLNDKGEPPRAQVLRLWAMHCGVPFDWLAYGSEVGPVDPGGQDLSPTRWLHGRVVDIRTRRIRALPAAA